jgi:hypothetical protein
MKIRSKSERQRIRESLTKKAEKHKRLRGITKRAIALMQRMGYTRDANTWRYFDVFLSIEIKDTVVRQEALKRIFSARGIHVKEDDEIVVSQIERMYEEYM